MTPGATYRLQLHAGFTFDDAAAVTGYLARLGVTHLYLSPSLASAPGSTHGYDVVDPTRIDDERGGAEGLARLSAAARDAGLGLVLDIVPNHIGLVPTANPWWWDVLEHGRDSAHARAFDIDWDAHGDGRVVVPELGAPIDEELARGDLRLVAERGRLLVAYHEHRWPTRPGTTDATGLPADPDAAASAASADTALLEAVLDTQHYRLVHWRRANAELNYRRFFDITTLGGLRIEDADVFDAAHARVLELVSDGTIDGLRVDHPDGLWDPTGYAERLRAAAPDTWLVFEKILEHGEELRRDWPIDGTVGYEHADLVLGQLVDAAATAPLTELYDGLLGAPQAYDAIVDRSKREVLDELFGAERRRLVDVLARAAEELDQPLSRAELERAIVEVVVAHPVYRTYVRPVTGRLDPADAEVVTSVLERARARLGADFPALELVADLVTVRRRSPHGDEFVHRLQQLTGPVMAKGVEDTTFYRYLRFAAVNEVGGDPSRLGRTLDELHEANARRQREHPTAMTATSTHDTKRSGDVRARLAACSQDPEAWVEAAERFLDLAARHHGPVGPSPNHAYLTFQTLVGAWPISADRLVAYLVKAAREEKRSTSWVDEDSAYEDDLTAFAHGVLADDEVLAHVEACVGRVRWPGQVAALAQALLALTSPGVPDVYQGTEVWDRSLVDPDNRRPVDFARLATLLDDLDGDPDPAGVLARADEGLPKLWVTHRALVVRRERPDAFGPAGAYAPLAADGGRADDVAAFLRGGEVATVVPRRALGRAPADGPGAWGDTALELPEGRWYDVLAGSRHTGGRTPVAALLDRFPVALLTRGDHP